MNEQVELKLELSQDAATFLEASPLLSRSATKADQRAIYFDTPAQTLLRHLDRLDGEARHIIRKDAKRLRYDAEFVGLLWVRKRLLRRLRRCLIALGRLQNKLGAINDLVTGPMSCENSASWNRTSLSPSLRLTGNTSFSRPPSGRPQS